MLVGLFVGGLGKRLGGVAKGNLKIDGGTTVLERLIATTREALPDARLLLVGEASAYQDCGLSVVADDPPGIGPLGGLRALLLHARAGDHPQAIALACDQPFLGAGLIRRLAREAPQATALAPRPGGVWQPLAARYALGALSAVEAGIGEHRHALHRVLERLGEGAVELGLSADEEAELRDWDRPEDVLKG